MIGRVLGRYRILAALGEGGMGTVWRAEDPALGRTVALKLLSPALLGDDDARARFLREARAAGALRHPNIAAVLDVGDNEGTIWIAYEFIDGESLATRCNSGPLPITEAIALARETAAALAHAHERGVLHRDVTAGNIMVTRESHAVLIDFGLARPQGAATLTRTGAMMGTAGYIAPEVIKGEQADARSDLYGLGAVLHLMLTSRLPFAGGPPEALLYHVLNETVAPISDSRPEISPALERVVLRLLEREPADRYGSAVEAEAALAEASVAAGPTPSDQKRREVARRARETGRVLRRLLRVRVGISMLLVLGAVAGALWVAARLGWLPGGAKHVPVVAVLPFENTSADPEEFAYLGEGLGDELVLKLGEAKGYSVLPWTSTRGTHPAAVDVRALAKQLHVDVVLVGTFRADDSRVRVTASLVDGRSGVQRWSRAFDQPIADLMTVQTNIAAGVASAIQGELGPEERRGLERRPSTSPEAYALYLQGANYLNSGDANQTAMAAPFFEKAIATDPELAEAHVGLGATKLDRYFRGEDAGLEVLRSAEADLKRALELTPGDPRALKGLLKVYWYTGRTEDVLRVGEQAKRRGEDDIEGLLIRGWACTLGSLPDVAVPLLDRVLELDRSNREAAWFRVVALAWSEQLPLALTRGKEFIRTLGEDPEVYTWMGASARFLGQRHEAELYYERALELFGDFDSNLYSITQFLSLLMEEGRTDRAMALANRWQGELAQRFDRRPDNDRILSHLIALDVVVGDTLAAAQHARVLIAMIEDPLPDHSDTPFAALVALSRLADPTLARDLCRALAREELGAFWLALEPNAIQLLATGETSSPARLPEYTTLIAGIRARTAELRRRYAPRLALPSTTQARIVTTSAH